MFHSLPHIALALIPVGVVIFLGWLAGYKKIIATSHSHSFATYVMSFSFPCSLFVLTATSDPAALFNGAFVAALWLGIIGMFVLSFIVYRLILRRPKKEAAQGAFVCSFADMAFMGIPIFTALLDQKALLSIAIANIGTSLLLIPIVTAFLDSTEKTDNIATIFVKVVTKPLVVAPILGTLYACSGWHLPEILKNSLTLIGSTTSGVSLFALGLIMSGFVIRFSRLVGINLLLKNVIHPLLMMALVALFGIKGDFAKEMILLGAMPTATMATMFALKYDVLTEESTTSTIVGTLVSLLTLSAFMLMLGV